MDDQRRPSAPNGLTSTSGPPDDLQHAILEGVRPCGEGRFAWEWGANAGAMAGETVSVYCAEPLCLQTGSCTGPRFVPHLNQLGRDGKPRQITPGEAVAASRTGAELARKETGRPDTRTDREVADHIALVYTRARAAVRG